MASDESKTSGGGDTSAGKYSVVFIRHGESEWNKANRFTGWTDVALTDKGKSEARDAGRRLAAAGFKFDVAYTSVLKRAIHTLWLALEEADAMHLPVIKDWRLNERHYGALQGLNKAETAAKHGEEQVHIWRRSFDIPPPELDVDDERYPGHDPRYAALTPEQLPRTESLKTTIDRVLPFWESEIVPSIKAGRRVVVVAHGNSLRALVKHLDGVSDEDIVGLNIPTGVPFVYTLDADMKAVEHRYLADDEALKAAQEAVANQGKAAAHE